MMLSSKTYGWPLTKRKCMILGLLQDKYY
uniref:Uncharacterized protein n=1 Tax=Arundo donax TaxID=35708 RepID=A0A0A9A7B6_ARUDO